MTRYESEKLMLDTLVKGATGRLNSVLLDLGEADGHAEVIREVVGILGMISGKVDEICLPAMRTARIFTEMDQRYPGLLDVAGMLTLEGIIDAQN